MKRDFNFILLAVLLMGCTPSNEYFPKNSIPEKNTYVKDEPISQKIIKKRKEFKHDVYPDFDYNHLGYLTEDGEYYYGYFDRSGYYCNDVYYSYDNRYIYEDRLNRRGYFSPRVRHFRTYREDDGNGHYYYVPNRNTHIRTFHPEYLEERNLGSGSYRDLHYEGTEK